jgi:hypothetical protein
MNNVMGTTQAVNTARYVDHTDSNNNNKCKVPPTTGHEGPDGEYSYSYTLFLTSALDGGGWPTPRSGHFTPGKHQILVV